MTQDSDLRPSSTGKRGNRYTRNRPVLVTPKESNEKVQSLDETMPTLAESLSEVQEQNPSVAPKARRLPGFFSTVGKKNQTEETQSTDAAKARLARATRGKAPVSSAKATSETVTEQKAEPKKAAYKSVAPARTASSSPFKTKYLIGMGLYLLGANFIGIFETQFFRNNHLDSVLAQFTLFGGKVVISTSTLVFLATLVIILVLLARFDLIPRSFSAMTGQSSQPQNRRSNSSANNNNRESEGTRNIPPTMKQGVKGSNDDLYQEYRANQRREKKK